MSANLIDIQAKRAMRPNYGASRINHQWTDDVTGLTFSGVLHYDYQADGEQIDGHWHDASSIEFRMFVLTHVSYGNTMSALQTPLHMNPDCCCGLDVAEGAISDVERGL